ncbi:MAG: hypothetical protein ACJAWV_003643 [Flammeovirgaceae bacterium]|jgi:hypothetical protein
MRILPVKGKYQLNLDCTHWEFGRLNIDLLFLSVIYQGVGLPIFWRVLGDKRDNSSQKERIKLLNQFICYFGKDSIDYLKADRDRTSLLY